MSSPVRLAISASDGAARRGLVETPHGSFETPGFMPVGTRGSVKTLDVRDLRESGAEIVLANTYHLMLRPGSGVIAAVGGLHRFMAWNGPILTDSGGYQVFSLQPLVDEQGVTFQSSYDGSLVTLTPEDAVRTQEELGPDIAMALDMLVGLPAPREQVTEAMERTLRWAERCLAVHSRSDQALFGIVQGGTDTELRARSARATADLGFAGYGIGGLSVGEDRPARNQALDVVMAELPREGVRYVMGVGDTEGVLDAIARGADLFDCVWPTRLARHGRVLSRNGDFHIRRSEFAGSEAPLDAQCSCLTCHTYSRAYLRHLHVTGELTALRLITIHNLAYTLELMARIRRAITAGSFEELRRRVVEQRVSGNPRAELR